MLACLLLGAAMVGLYHLLPRTRPGRPFRAALLVLGGFIAAMPVVQKPFMYFQF
jgi:hypothetical protein